MPNIDSEIGFRRGRKKKSEAETNILLCGFSKFIWNDILFQFNDYFAH